MINCAHKYKYGPPSYIDSRRLLCEQKSKSRRHLGRAQKCNVSRLRFAAADQEQDTLPQRVLRGGITLRDTHTRTHAHDCQVFEKKQEKNTKEVRMVFMSSLVDTMDSFYQRPP